MTFFVNVFVLFVISLSVHADLPVNYESLNGCEKQSILWKKVEKSAHKRLPKYKDFSFIELIRMSFSRLKIKNEFYSDLAPKGWVKLLHRRGAMAKVKYVSKGDHSYTGIFKGAECALIRLSLTFDPNTKKGVAPGLALKILRDKTHSANISMLYTLKGQGKNYNFFENSLSNIVPIVSSYPTKFVHDIFKRVTDYPEELVLTDMSEIDTYGDLPTQKRSPRQLFLVPSKKISFKSDKHEIRKDFLTIPSGTTLYEVRAVDVVHLNFNYQNYTMEDLKSFSNSKSSTLIGELVTTSKFVASEFADSGIFFRHQVREKSKE
jgi:hypothetical protein